jgi:hypothetical protein
MSELIVAAFRGADSAEQALEKLLTLEPVIVADLEDAVVAVRDSRGKVRLRQTSDPLTLNTTRGFAWGGLLGTLAGLLLIHPLAGLAAGLVLGAGAGRFPARWPTTASPTTSSFTQHATWSPIPRRCSCCCGGSRSNGWRASWNPSAPASHGLR